ncbi:hypothetical protein ACOSQ4_008826 [Xanthoceras sorbifolium]
MADDPPLPIQIENIPVGVTKFPFTKSLTASDMSSVGLILTGDAKHLTTVNDGRFKQKIESKKGLPVEIHTPIGPVLQGCYIAAGD